MFSNTFPKSCPSTKAPAQKTHSSDSDEDAVIPPKKLYSDGYELLEKTWSPSVLPDYGHPSNTSIATDSQSLAFLEQLQGEFRKTRSNIRIPLPKAPWAQLNGVETKPRKQGKKTVWELFSASIEQEIKNGNPNAPVPGGSHPKQADLHLLLLDRRFGHSNKFSAEEIMATRPPLPFPILKEYDY